MQLVQSKCIQSCRSPPNQQPAYQTIHFAMIDFPKRTNETNIARKKPMPSQSTLCGICWNAAKSSHTKSGWAWLSWHCNKAGTHHRPLSSASVDFQKELDLIFFVPDEMFLHGIGWRIMGWVRYEQTNMTRRWLKTEDVRTAGFRYDIVHQSGSHWAQKSKAIFVMKNQTKTQKECELMCSAVWMICNSRACSGKWVMIFD